MVARLVSRRPVYEHSKWDAEFAEHTAQVARLARDTTYAMRCGGPLTEAVVVTPGPPQRPRSGGPGPRAARGLARAMALGMDVVGRLEAPSPAAESVAKSDAGGVDDSPAHLPAHGAAAAMATGSTAATAAAAAPGAALASGPDPLTATSGSAAAIGTV